MTPLEKITPETLALWKRLADEAKNSVTVEDTKTVSYSMESMDVLIEAVPALIEEVERYRKVELFQEKWTGDNYAKQLEETAKIVEENDRLRKQLALCKEQRNIYHTICDENDLVNYHRHIKALDAEIDAIGKVGQE